ncbi:MAG: hypothetical protein Q8927_06270 [Bacteroidota bacterium]|nr:hypothetical protein [Bacteroidota bacterium]MDP4215789.1 hypothetical protein [Bacteroidota bacterium]MDP4257642.1 hypothetical protein [Bacteroidota bacterium]
MDEKKTYQVTYKVYHNERLKKVSFHGKLVYPLYLRLTFDRRTTEYRSNLFDLFMKPKYGIRVSGEIFPPHLDKIIEREEKLIEFVIDRHPEDFSLELFKKEYDYYGRDLLDEMEEGFLNYLRLFFDDEGMPYLGDVFALSYREVTLYDVVLDLKRALKPDLYQRLIEHSFLFSPPYYPLHQCLETPLRPNLKIFTIMDWEDSTTRHRFQDFMKRFYPHQDVSSILGQVEKWLKR